MPLSKVVLNAFTAREVADISGLSKHMVTYLASSGFLLPSYRPGPRDRRGSVRYYSYRDLVVARIVRRLSLAGIELKRLKAALVKLQSEKVWRTLGQASCALLVTDGRSILIRQKDGSIVDLTANRQLAFTFVIDLAAADADIRKKVGQLKDERLDHYSYEVRPLIVAAKGNQALKA